MKHAHFLFRLLRRRDGVALIEFALILPFMLILLYGSIEVGRFMLITQKVDKAAFAMSNITNQFPPATAERKSGEINVAQMNDVVFRQFEALMDPYDAAGNGAVVITSLRKESGVPVIKWQIAGGGSGGGGNTSAVSGLTPTQTNAEGAALKNRIATFSPEIAGEMAAMDNTENMIVSEVFYTYQPLLNSILPSIGETTLIRRSFTTPRIGDLACLPDTFVYPDCEAVGPPVDPSDPTPPVGGTRSCRDECNEEKVHGARWCEYGDASRGIRATLECRDGSVYNLGGISGIGCDGSGDLRCE